MALGRGAEAAASKAGSERQRIIPEWEPERLKQGPRTIQFGAPRMLSLSTLWRQKEKTMSTLSKWNPIKISRWEPFRELEEIERRLESLFERSPFARTREELQSAQEWSPMVDISENDKEYLLKADLPEVAKSDIKVSFRDGVLEISGERKKERHENTERIHRSERSYGAFLRSFTLPSGAEGEKAKAEFKDGVLFVRIPKNEKSAIKAIEVKVT